MLRSPNYMIVLGERSMNIADRGFCYANFAFNVRIAGDCTRIV